MTTLEKTRLDVEREIAVREERIENAVARLKGDVSTPVPIVGQFVKRYPVETLVGVVAVSALAGLLFARSTKKTKGSGSSDGVKTAYAEAVNARARAEEEKGASRDEAIRRAIEANPPMLVASSNSEPPGLFHVVGDRILKTFTAIAFDYASTWINELVEGRRRTS